MSNVFLRQMQQQEFDALVGQWAAENGQPVGRSIRVPQFHIPEPVLREFERKSGHHYGPARENAQPEEGR